MASQRKNASAEVLLLCRDSVPPELLAAKLDALDSDARFALFNKKKNIAGVASKLAEEASKKRELSFALVRQLARTVPGFEKEEEETANEKIKKELVETALVAALSAALNAVLEYALTDNEGPSDEEMETAFVTMDSLVAAAGGLVALKGEVRDMLGENFTRGLTVMTTEPILPVLLRRDASQVLLDLVTCSKPAATIVRAIFEDGSSKLGEIYMDNLKDVGDLVTQVNIAETIYRVNKDALFTNLGPDREAPPIGKVLGVHAFGSVKHDLYGLLSMRRAPRKEALFHEMRNLVTRMNRALPGAERKVHTFLPEAVVVQPTRVERPEEGGGWELLEDVYSKRIDFNQTGFTLHQVQESDQPGAKTAGGSQPPGSQGPPSAAVEQSDAVDVEYTNIRCIKRDTKDAFVIWTIGLNKPLDEDDDDDPELSEDAIAARANALKAMTTTDAAITLKFPLIDAASLEACVMPLIFEVNPGVIAEQPKLAALKMSHATLVQGKSAMDSQQPHGGGGGSLLDDATVIGALQAAAPSENFGGPPPERPLRIVQPLGGTALRDVFGGDKGAADSQALAPLGTHPGVVVPSGGGGGGGGFDSQYIGTQRPKATQAAANEAGLHKFMDHLLPDDDFGDVAAEAAREAAADAARRKKKAPPPPAADSDSDDTKDSPGPMATQAPRRPSAAAPPPPQQQQTWGKLVALGAAAPAPLPSAAKGAAKGPAAAPAAAKAADAKKKSVTIKKPTQDPTPEAPPPDSELTDPPATGAAEPDDPFAFVLEPAAKPAAAKKGKGAAKAGGGGDKRVTQATPKRAPKKAPLGLTASLGSGGKHVKAVPPRAAAAPSAKVPPTVETWDAPPAPGFLGAQTQTGGAVEVDDSFGGAPLEEEEAAPAPAARKSALAANVMPPPPPRVPAAAAGGGRKSVAAPKTAEPEQMAAAAAAAKRKAADEQAAAAATAAAAKEQEAAVAAAKKAAEAEAKKAAAEAAAVKKAAAAAAKEEAAKKTAGAEKVATAKKAAAAEKAAAADAARHKKAAAAEQPKRKAASASEDSSERSDCDDDSDEEEEEEAAAAAPAPRQRGAKAAAARAADDVTPADRVAEVALQRAAQALAKPPPQAEEAAQTRRAAKPPRSPPAPTAANPRRTSAELVQRLLAGVEDDAPVAQSSGLTACEPIEPRMLFRSMSTRPQKRKPFSSPSDAPIGGGAEDGGAAGGRAAKRARPLPVDPDDPTVTALHRIVAEAKAAAIARAKEEIAAMLSGTWQELDAALTSLAQRHADERDAMAAEFKASRAATVRRLNASRDEYTAAVKRFKTDVVPLVSSRGGATDTLASLDAAMEDRHAEARQKHAAELKSVTKKMNVKLKQLDEDIARMDTSKSANAQVKNTLEQLLSRM